MPLKFGAGSGVTFVPYTTINTSMPSLGTFTFSVTGVFNIYNTYGFWKYYQFGDGSSFSTQNNTFPPFTTQYAVQQAIPVGANKYRLINQGLVTTIWVHGYYYSGVS